MWKIKGMALHACSLLNSYGEGSLFLCRKQNFVTEVCMGLETMWSALAAVRPVMEVSSMALRSHLLQALAAEGCPHLEIKWFCLFPSLSRLAESKRSISCTRVWSEKQRGKEPQWGFLCTTGTFHNPVCSSHSRWFCSACSWHYFRMISLVTTFWIFNIFLTVSYKMSFICTSLILDDWQPWWMQRGEQMYWKEWF